MTDAGGRTGDASSRQGLDLLSSKPARYVVAHRKERRMETDLTELRWFKSSASSTGGCVEIAHLPSGGVAVRDTKDRSKTPHVFNRHEWECFLIGAKNGEFDLPS
jgi:hypothetical protein